MKNDGTSRRDYLKTLAAGAGLATAGAGCGRPPDKKAEAAAAPVLQPPPDHDRRIQWWRDAKFGMFIHWGLYSQLGRQEWVMSLEDIPVNEYEKLAKTFKPKPAPARDWARLAKQAGMKYMVMTTKHHEGFCNFDSKLTDYCATKQGPGRDLVREYVDAARAEGLRMGFYYSLMDWHHPDGMSAKDDPAARRRFVDYIHGQIRELMTNYGKIDILWYDVAVPLDAEGWESEKMNQMVLQLQPDIIVNNRNWLPGDFSTPEQTIQATRGDWESCMTLNDSWGYTTADDNWKSPERVVRNLVQCAQDGGNFLLNIGPTADGSIPEPSVRILTAVGKWMQRNGSTIYGAQKSKVNFSNVAGFTRKGNTLYTQVHFWPGSKVTIGGITTKPASAKLLTTGKDVPFTLNGTQLTFTDLPVKAPDDPVTVIAAEFDSEPVQRSLAVRVIDIINEIERKQPHPPVA
jgi:alpha-L-fucosidase